MDPTHVRPPLVIMAICEPCQALQRITGEPADQEAAVAAFLVAHDKAKGCDPHFVTGREHHEVSRR
jgi:hypothetical protein